MEAVPVRHEEDESDHETSASEPDTTSNLVEEHKSVILHLLSQLKLGMDLTKVVLPTFILEKRSLLEMFADCMAHPYLFLRINDCPDPELRIMAVLEWFLTSFHAGRQVNRRCCNTFWFSCIRISLTKDNFYGKTMKLCTICFFCCLCLFVPDNLIIGLGNAPVCWCLKTSVNISVW